QINEYKKNTMKNKVLVLEDDIVIAKSIQIGLISSGFDPHIATRFNSAIRLFEQHDFDAAICDINLKQTSDGIDFVTETIKGKIPVIFLTAYSDLNTIKRVEPICPYAFLTKPFNNNQLILTLKLALKNSTRTGLIPTEDIQNAFTFKMTKRELEIIEQMSLGKTTKEIADNLNISPLTVSTHRKNILGKTSAKNSIELIAIAKQKQWM